MNSYRKQLLLRHRRTRRTKATRRFLVVGGGSLLILVIFGVFLFSKYFWVDKVVIEGYARTTESELRTHIDQWLSKRTWVMPLRRPSWLFSATALTADLLVSFPTLKEVTIDRDFPRGIHVSVVEYAAWGVLCQGEPEKCFWIDRAGVAFATAPQFSGLIVPKIRTLSDREIKLGGVVLSPKTMKLIAYFNERVAMNDKLQSLQFTLGEEDRTVTATTRAGWDILLLETTAPESAYKNLVLSLEREVKDKAQDLDYMDLRFEGRVFYKFREQ